MLDLIDLSQAGILCGLLSIYVLLFKKNALRSYSDYLLSSFIFFQCWTAGAFVLIFTGAIVEIPFFFKTAAPINFLIPPLGFLYVRSVLFNERKWTRYDLLHLLPFVIFLVSYLPFFLSATDLRLKFIGEALADENAAVDQSLGLLSESIFHFFRLGQAVLYLAAQWWLIAKFHKEKLGPSDGKPNSSGGGLAEGFYKCQHAYPTQFLGACGFVFSGKRHF